jgi:hypothetical protein
MGKIDKCGDNVSEYPSRHVLRLYYSSFTLTIDMHSIWSRINNTSAFLSSCLMVLLMAIALSSFAFNADPKADVSVLSVKVSVPSFVLRISGHSTGGCSILYLSHVTSAVYSVLFIRQNQSSRCYLPWQAYIHPKLTSVSLVFPRLHRDIRVIIRTLHLCISTSAQVTSLLTSYPPTLISQPCCISSPSP